MSSTTTVPLIELITVPTGRVNGDELARTAP